MDGVLVLSACAVNVQRYCFSVVHRLSLAFGLVEAARQ